MIETRPACAALPFAAPPGARTSRSLLGVCGRQTCACSETRTVVGTAAPSCLAAPWRSLSPEIARLETDILTLREVLEV